MMIETTRYEVRWEYQFDSEVFQRSFRDPDVANRFRESLEKLGGLEWIALSETRRRELERTEPFADWVRSS